MPRPAIHPGEILADELEDIGVTPTELSRQIAVPPNRITQIIQGKRAITGDTALRLGHWFKTSRNSGSICRPPTTCGLRPRRLAAQSPSSQPGRLLARRSGRSSPASYEVTIASWARVPGSGCLMPNRLELALLPNFVFNVSCSALQRLNETA